MVFYRYGRIPKPTKPLTYSDNDETNASVSETAPASPAGSTSATKQKLKCTAKRKRSSKPQSVQESKKPKLVTLRASQSEYSDDEENEKQLEEEEVEEVQQPECSSGSQSSAAAFVPSSLRSPRPVITEVEETMEEVTIFHHALHRCVPSIYFTFGKMSALSTYFFCAWRYVS